MPSVESIVEECFKDRLSAWDDAQQQVERWLSRQCSELLDGRDSSRLAVGTGRIKTSERALDKLKRKIRAGECASPASARDVENELRDLVGVKVLCKSTRDQYLLRDRLDKLAGTEDGFRARIFPDTPRGSDMGGAPRKDYVTNPKESGYRAIHYEYTVPVTGTDPVTVEVQVKTRVQDAWGELTHEDLYKPGASLKPSPFHQSVAKTIANLLSEVDRLSDDLAHELEQSVTPSSKEDLVDNHHDTDQELSAENNLEVTVRRTGPTYALAVDADGRQGLIPAYAVRDVLDTSDYIDVDDHVKEGMTLDVAVLENDDGLYFLPLSVPSA